MTRVLVVAAHPDDEVYGCGGTIAKFSQEGAQVFVLIVTRADELFGRKAVERVRKEAQKAHKILGVKETWYADLPAVKLDVFPKFRINEVLSGYFQKVKPDFLFIPFLGDLNQDHQILHQCALVGARPHLLRLRGIFSYEALSSTNWNSPGLTPSFTPNTFVDITKTIDLKLKAVKAYRSQLMPYPHERSPEAVKNLAKYRGGFVNLPYAEAFVSLRQILSLK